jgi:hypothetical protein
MNPYLTYIEEIEEVRFKQGFCEEAIENFGIFATLCDQIINQYGNLSPP